MPSLPKSLSVSDVLVRWLPMIGICGVIAYQFWYVSSLALNLPFMDDIYDFLQVVTLIESADSPGDAIKEWFSNYINHRTIVQRSVVYAAYLIEGEVNFRTLTLLANLALPMILWLFYLSVEDEEYRWIFLFVSALILLSLRTPILTLHSQGAFAYYFVFFYAFACLFALHKVTLPKFVLAAMLCTFAMFTFASGQIAWVLGLTSLLHQSWVTGRRSFMYPVMWLLVSIAMLLVWRIGFESPAAPDISPEQLSALRALPHGVLIDPPLFQALVRYATWFLVMLGCTFIDSSTLAAGAVGLVMLAVLLFVTVRFYKDDDIRLMLCCWFVVGTAAAASVGRALLLGAEYILLQRFSFFAMMLMSTLVLLVLKRFRVFRTPVVSLVVLLAAVFWVWTYRHFDSTLHHNLRERYADYNAGNYSVFGKPQAESLAIVSEAIAAGIYNPPCKPLPACQSSQTRGE